MGLFAIKGGTSKDEPAKIAAATHRVRTAGRGLYANMGLAAPYPATFKISLNRNLAKFRGGEMPFESKKLG